MLFSQGRPLAGNTEQSSDLLLDQLLMGSLLNKAARIHHQDTIS